MLKIVLIAFCLLWFGNSFVLEKIYDVTNYDGYKAFWNARDILYDSMYFLMSVAMFLLLKLLSMPFERATACYMMLITFGSVFDKAVLKVFDYMLSDLILVPGSILVSTFRYVRETRRGS